MKHAGLLVVTERNCIHHISTDDPFKFGAQTRNNLEQMHALPRDREAAAQLKPETRSGMSKKRNKEYPRWIIPVMSGSRKIVRSLPIPSRTETPTLAFPSHLHTERVLTVFRRVSESTRCTVISEEPQQSYSTVSLD